MRARGTGGRAAKRPYALRLLRATGMCWRGMRRGGRGCRAAVRLAPLRRRGRRAAEHGLNAAHASKGAQVPRRHWCRCGRWPPPAPMWRGGGDPRRQPRSCGCLRACAELSHRAAVCGLLVACTGARRCTSVQRRRGTHSRVPAPRAARCALCGRRAGAFRGASSVMPGADVDPEL
eukprot:scaffold3721_cov134-Isochrysis_galbana.AAC.19